MKKMNVEEVISPTGDMYSSDGKLNFLYSLELMPTPLVMKCPNATKRWLSADVPVVGETIQDIGIHARYDEIDTSSTIYEHIDNPIYKVMSSPMYDTVINVTTNYEQINNSDRTCDKLNNSNKICDKLDNSESVSLTVNNSAICYDSKAGNSDSLSGKYNEIEPSPSNLDFVSVSLSKTNEPVTTIYPSKSYTPKFSSDHQHCQFNFDQNKCIYTTSHQNSFGMVTPSPSLPPLNSLSQLTPENVLAIVANGKCLNAAAISPLPSFIPLNSLNEITPENVLTIVANGKCVNTDVTSSDGDLMDVNNDCHSKNPVGTFSLISECNGGTSNATDASRGDTLTVSYHSVSYPTNGISPGINTLDVSNEMSEAITNKCTETISKTSPLLQNILLEQTRMRKCLEILSDDSQLHRKSHESFQDDMTKKLQNDLQERVMNEIVCQEINQTIFAKASIGKTQGYLSELLRTSKLLQVKEEKEYRRTRHNLGKIENFLRKPKCERVRIYKDCSATTKTDGCTPIMINLKQKRTAISADAKKTLKENFDYFHQHDRKLSDIDFQCLSSQLNLDLQSVKIFYKNWKQRTKMKSQ